MAQRIAMDDLDGSSGVPPVFTEARGRRGRQVQTALPADVGTLLVTMFPSLSEQLGLDVRDNNWSGSHRVETFLDLLLDEDDEPFDLSLLDQAATMASPQAVATELLAPAARLLGDYWRMDVCDFMKVTVVMGRIQRLFWSLVSLDPPIAVHGHRRSALLAPAPDEQHSFGLVIVEDALRRAGWQVDRCCVDEEQAYFELLAANDYSVIGLSLSGSARAPGLAAFIRKSRKKSHNASARILLGGHVFAETPDLAFEAGADLFAHDAPSAVSAAETAISSLRSS